MRPALNLQEKDVTFMKDGKIERLEEFAAIYREVMGNLEELPLYTRLTRITKHAARICSAEASGTLLVKREGYLTFAAGCGYLNQQSLIGQEFAICNGPSSGLTG